MQSSDFSSIQKLISFGMDSTFATKMIESMNVAMSNMSVPGSMTNYLPSENDTASTQLWYAVIEGFPVGPLDKKEMLSFLLNKKITKDSLVWRLGMRQWQRAEDVPDVIKLVLQLPPNI